MQSHRHLTTEELLERLHTVTDTLFSEYVVPNPYVQALPPTYAQYSHFVNELIESQFDVYDQHVALANPPTPCVVQHQVPQAPDLQPNFEHAIRCASNTLANGQRCRRAAFLPFTLCSVHFRYWKVHNRLPFGGASAPGRPHPEDKWEAPKPPLV